MKMERILIVLLIGYIRTQACSPSLNWVPPTIEQQALKAGVVFEGVAVKTVENENFWEYMVTFSNVKYYKSCGPSEVQVKGFRQSSLCGYEPPADGTKLIVFACKDDKSEFFNLNQIDIHTGGALYTEENDMKVKKVLKVQQSVPGESCGDEVYQKCEKMDPVKQQQNFLDDEFFLFQY